jgi:hypothetical protein
VDALSPEWRLWALVNGAPALLLKVPGEVPTVITVTVSGRYPLAEAAAAHALLQKRGTVGKLLLCTQ